jgi:hypothetical protein
MVQWQNNKGATSLAEYAVTVFLVIATITAMTTYVQRTLQARMRDARHYMVTNVSEACDPGYCGPAADLKKYQVNVGGITIEKQKIGEQYEPYYAQVNAQVSSDREKSRALMASDQTAGTFMGLDNSQTAMVSLSNQAAPGHARTADDQALGMAD